MHCSDTKLINQVHSSAQEFSNINQNCVCSAFEGCKQLLHCGLNIHLICYGELSEGFENCAQRGQIVVVFNIVLPHLSNRSLNFPIHVVSLHQMQGWPNLIDDYLQLLPLALNPPLYDVQNALFLIVVVPLQFFVVDIDKHLFVAVLGVGPNELELLAIQLITKFALMMPHVVVANIAEVQHRQFHIIVPIWPILQHVSNCFPYTSLSPFKLLQKQTLQIRALSLYSCPISYVEQLHTELLFSAQFHLPAEVKAIFLAIDEGWRALGVVVEDEEGALGRD